MSDKFENSNTVDTPKEETIEQQKEISVIKDKLEDLKKETQESIVVNTIVKSITEKKDLIEPDKEGLKELGELVKNKEYGKALSVAFKVISKLLSFKLKSGFSHLKSEEGSMNLDELIKGGKSEELKRYIKQYEDSFSKNVSLSDKTDLTYLMSKCKDALYDIVKKNEGKNTTQTTKFEYFKNSLTNNGTTSPIGKVILFNWGDFKYDGGQKMFDKGVQSSSGSIWEHAALITGYNKDTGEITITHSRAKGGVHTTTIKEYLAATSTDIDIMTLNIPEDKKQSVVQYVEQQKGKKYDTKGAVNDVLSEKSKSDDSQFYCSELIYKGLKSTGTDISNDLIYPGQMLSILKPDYVTSIKKSEL